MQNFYKNKKILITGHTGFKGSWLAYILSKWGANVVGVALPPHTSSNLFDALRLSANLDNYFMDIRDREGLLKIFQKEKPEIVFHLAAQTIVRRSYEEDILTYETNVLGTVDLLNCMKNIKSVRAGVIITTDKVYENNHNHAYKETDKLGGGDPYSSSKAAADIITQSYIKSFFNPKQYNKKNKTLIGIARAGNVIGGGDWAEDRLIPDIIRSIYTGDGVVKIRNPHAIRPWQHVLDVLSGYLLLGKRLYEGATDITGAYNFGPKESQINSKGFSVEDLVKYSLEFLCKGYYEVQPDPTRPESDILRLDSSKAQTLLGWSPKLNLEQSLLKTLEWYRVYYEDIKKISELTRHQIESFFN